MEEAMLQKSFKLHNNDRCSIRFQINLPFFLKNISITPTSLYHFSKVFKSLLHSSLKCPYMENYLDNLFYMVLVLIQIYLFSFSISYLYFLRLLYDCVYSRSNYRGRRLYVNHKNFN